MENTPAISIIVAVYNAEKYIRRCLDSIQSQTFTDFEVLLIDDGSSDKSGEICDEYSDKDKRFRVIHKENGGVSSARQCGVDNAVGKYSIHVDPDDWVEHDYLEAMYSQIIEEDADICICQCMVEYENCKKYPPFIKFNSAKYRNPIDILLPTYGTALWNKLIRHSLYQKYNLKFPKSISMGEDSYVLVKLLMNDVKIALADKYLYHYDKYINPNSLTTGYNYERFQNQHEYIRLIEELESETRLLSNHKKKKIIENAHDAFYFNILNQIEYTRRFGKYFFSVLSSSIPTHKKINILLSIMGLKWPVHPIYLFLKKKFYTHE